MSETTNSLLSRLAARGGENDAPSWAAIATTQPQHAAATPARQGEPATKSTTTAPTSQSPIANANASPQTPTDVVRQRIAALKDELKASPQAVAEPARDKQNDFLPVEPQSFRQAQVNENLVDSLLLKYLLAGGCCTGRECAEQVKLPFQMVDGLLRQLKTDQMVVYSGTAPMNDYSYQLTDLGRERARRLSQHCTYFGSAPVSLDDYIASVKAQSLTTQHPSVNDLKAAFEDLLINEQMLNRLGPAINSARGLFLYGAAGNGKTSIAERVTKAFGESLWIPRALGVDGEIIRVFDPMNHEELPLPASNGLLDQRRIDKRWVLVRRPTIVVGGELTMENLEVTHNQATGICEAPLQLKSNCGTLVIDDFGRQRMSTHELLNRWIVPLEKRFDFLNLPNGKKVQVPFDQLIIFSTNLEPRDLVDEAFLRRIPYKIDVQNPSEAEFRSLFRIMAERLDVEFCEEAMNYLLDKHYRPVNRPFRNCQPRDLLLQIRNFCLYQNLQPAMNAQFFDFAVENYFAVM